MNYNRGRQFIIHDLRLQAVQDPAIQGPENPVEPWTIHPLTIAPACWRSYPSDDWVTIGTILSFVASACDNEHLPAGSRFDALHIMAHGLPGDVQIGREGLKKENLHLLVKIANRFRFVVFHACLVGKMSTRDVIAAPASAFGGSQFARKVAQHTKAKVVAAREVQYYQTKTREGMGVATLDYGAWEGPVDLYEEHVPVRTFNNPLDAPFDLEALIFGAPKKP